MFKSFFSPLTTFKAIHIIVIVGLIVFCNMLFNNFVWDDKTFIILNPDVHSLNLLKILGQNMFNDTVYYRPISLIYFASLYSIFTTNAFPYHFLQLSLHMLNTFLLYKLFSSFFKKGLSLLLCLIFLVHPMQVESVSYIAGSGDLIFFLFGLSALLYLKKGEKLSFLRVSILLLLSLFTKEAGIIFLFLFNIYVFLYKKTKRASVVFASVITLLIYFSIWFSVRYVFFTKSTLVAPIVNMPLFERLSLMPGIIFYYFKTFFYPVALAIDQHWTIVSLNFQNFYLPFAFDLLVLILLGCLGYSCFKNSKTQLKTFIFFAVWLLIGLSMHSQIIPLDLTVADRWFYVTMVGALGVLGVGLEMIMKNNSPFQKLSIALTIVVICLLSVRTISRNTNWNDAVTLYSHDIKIADNFDIENGLGWEYIQSHQYALAISHIKKSIQYRPEWDRNWYNLGVAYHFKGNIASAKASYEKALNYNSEYVQAQENLGYLLTYYYDVNAAKKLLTKAIAKHPQRSKLWYFRSLANYKLGNRNEALIDIQNASNLNPNDSDITNIQYLIVNHLPIKFQ
jgi:protein O-mannosyl-transferase